MEGASGRAKMMEMMGGLRGLVAEKSSLELAGVAVETSFDRRDEGGVFGPILSGTDASARNVLAFHLADGSRAVVRPSGTEPKAKLYIEVSLPALGEEASDEALAQQLDEAAGRARAVADAFRQLALRQVGIDLPSWVFACSNTLGIESLQGVAAAVPDIARQLSDAPAHAAESIGALCARLGPDTGPSSGGHRRLPRRPGCDASCFPGSRAARRAAGLGASS